MPYEIDVVKRELHGREQIVYEHAGLLNRCLLGAHPACSQNFRHGAVGQVGSCIAAFKEFTAFSSHRLVKIITHLTRHDDKTFVTAQWDK
jgi:hypothetical protein